MAKWRYTCTLVVPGSSPPPCLTGYVLGRPEFNSLAALCKSPTGLPPTSCDFQALCVYLKYLFLYLAWPTM